MRRKEREITDDIKINEIIQKCKICRVGFNDNGEVYIVPVNFGFVDDNGKRIFYFHGARKGRKVDLIKQNPRVGFELDTGFELWEGKYACDFSAGYQSVIGTGTISIVEEFEDKKAALIEIMSTITDNREWQFDKKMVEAVAVFKLEVADISCKENVR